MTPTQLTLFSRPQLQHSAKRARHRLPGALVRLSLFSHQPRSVSGIRSRRMGHPSEHEDETSPEKEESPFVWAFFAQKGGIF